MVIVEPQQEASRPSGGVWPAGSSLSLEPDGRCWLHFKLLLFKRSQVFCLILLFVFVALLPAGSFFSARLLGKGDRPTRKGGCC